MLFRNTEMVLSPCLMRIKIVKVKIYLFFFQECSNDKLKNQERPIFSLLVGEGGIDGRLCCIKVTISSFGDFDNT